MCPAEREHYAPAELEDCLHLNLYKHSVPPRLNENHSQPRLNYSITDSCGALPFFKVSTYLWRPCHSSR
jgi:hypothetical protein